MAFKPSLEAEAFIETVHSRVRARTKAVLARSAVFLSLGDPSELPSKLPPAGGKDIAWDALVGDLEDVLRAALHLRAGRALPESELQHEFRRHFERGCRQMEAMWKASGNDQSHFIAELLKRAHTGALPTDSGDQPGKDGGNSPTATRKIVDREVKLKLLLDEEPWSLNGPGTRSGLLVVSGGSGSGKTQLVLDLLAQLSGQGVRFVFFDLKGELEEDPDNARQTANRRRFLEQTGASYVRLIREELPINPLWRDGNDAVNAQTAFEIASLFGAFVPQLGAVQVGQLNEAYQAMQRPDFTAWLLELEERGAAGVHRETLKRICDVNLFATADFAVPLDQWLARSLVIDFKQFGNDDGTKALAVALILNLLMKRLNQQLAPKDGVQPLKMVLFVDEAHLLLPKEGKIGLLGSLARQGRSWGFPVWLASQDADAFETKGEKAVDFADLGECGVHFTPQTLSPAAQKRIIGGVLTRELQKGEAAVKLAGKMKIGKARQYHRDGGTI